MALSTERLTQLEAEGWRFSRDGSTATARREWTDPDDADSGWLLLVLHTAGHGARFSLQAEGWGLTERGPGDAEWLTGALTQAGELLRGWAGETPDEADGLAPKPPPRAL